MHERLKEAFNQVQADEELKNSTKEYLFRKTKGYAPKKAVNYRVLLSAAACMMLFLFGGHQLYFTPTTEISIDINPSMELAVNRFDRVISVDGYNDDGEKLAASLDLKYMNYSDAVNEIIENKTVTSLLSRDEILSITVTGNSSSQSSRVLSDIQTCTEGRQNTYCYSVRPEEVETAHELGLSYGKYRAFLDLQALAPEITASDVRDMTMREIKDLTEKLSEKETEASSASPKQGRKQGQQKGRQNQQGQDRQQGKQKQQGQARQQRQQKQQGQARQQGQQKQQGQARQQGQQKQQGQARRQGQQKQQGQGHRENNPKGRQNQQKRQGKNS